MQIEKEFQTVAFLNSGKSSDYRFRLLKQLHGHDIKAQRFPLANVKKVKLTRGYASRADYVKSLALRLIIRKAMKSKARAVLIMMEDIILHHQFKNILSVVTLPADWGLLLLGCEHKVRPTIAGYSLLRTEKTINNCLFGIRSEYFTKFLKDLCPMRAPSGDWLQKPTCDDTISNLSELVPSYSVSPILAWRHSIDFKRTDWNSPEDSIPSAPDWNTPSLLDGVPAGALKVKTRENIKINPTVSEVNIAFLFLTRDEINNHQIWEEYFSGNVNCKVYCHSKSPGKVSLPWQKAALIEEKIATQWGHISIVRAMLALLGAAVKKNNHSHFVFLSESCVPIKPLSILQSYLRMDGRSVIDWRYPGMLSNSDPLRLRRLNVAPLIPQNCWRFHGQWFMLDREAVNCLLQDDLTLFFEHVHAPDEAYFVTALQMQGFPIMNNVSRRALTFTKWDIPGSPHPRTFAELTSEVYVELMKSDCFFARKFLSSCIDVSKYRLHC